jgi:hypothetical protein
MAAKVHRTGNRIWQDLGGSGESPRRGTHLRSFPILSIAGMPGLIFTSLRDTRIATEKKNNG